MKYNEKQLPLKDNVSGGESQVQIDANMDAIKKHHPKLFQIAKVNVSEN